MMPYRALRFVVGVASAGAVLTTPPSDSVRLQLAGPVPYLRVLGDSLVRIRLENRQTGPLEGGSTADWDHGRPLAFAGAWFADGPASVVAPFEVTVRLPAPVPAGTVGEIELPIRPVRPGRRWLCFGVVRSSRDGSAYATLTEPFCVPVQIAAGSFLENHRPELLRAVVAAHWIALVAFAAAAGWSSRTRR
jgi:hypothetical protein